MNKKPIKEIRSGYKSTGDMNDNFNELEDRIDNSLSRTLPTDGSENQMETELDMNGRRIINTGDAVDDKDAVNKVSLDKLSKELFSKVDSAVSNISVPNEDDTLFLDNLSQLQAFDQSSNSNISLVFLRRINSVGRDYRGGWFEWDSSSLEDTDEGGATVRPFNISSSEPGRWKRIDKNLEPIVVAAFGQSNFQQNLERTTTVSESVFQAQGPFNPLSTSIVDNGDGTVTPTHKGYMDNRVRVYRPGLKAFGPIPTGIPSTFVEPFGQGLNNVALGFCNRVSEETGRRVYLIIFAKGGRPFESFLIDDPRDPIIYGDFDTGGANWVEFNNQVVAGLAELGRSKPDIILIHLMEAHAIGTIGIDGFDRSTVGGIGTTEGFNSVLDKISEQLATVSWGGWDIPIVAGEGYYRGNNDRQGADRNAELNQWPDRRSNLAIASAEGYYSEDNVHFDSKHDFGYYRYWEAAKSVAGRLLEDHSGGKQRPSRDWLVKTNLNSRGTLGHRFDRRILEEGVTVNLTRKDLQGVVVRGRANRINLPVMSTNGRDDGLTIRLYMYSPSLPSGIAHPEMSSQAFPEWTRGCVLDLNGANIRNIKTNETNSDGYLIVDTVSYIELMWYSGQWLFMVDDRPKVEDITGGFMTRNADNYLEICQTLVVPTTRNVNFTDIAGTGFSDTDYFIDVKYVDQMDDSGNTAADIRFVDPTKFPGVTNITANGLTLVNNLGFTTKIRLYVKGRR